MESSKGLGVNCGNCVTGCNVGAKNTLYMNYLPMAQRAGAVILTQNTVQYLQKLTTGGWRIHGQQFNKRWQQQAVSNGRHAGSALGGIAQLYRDPAAV
ncbi:MAG: hypothetical protein WDO73_17955 [Ignavibacteriota bacterium]